MKAREFYLKDIDVCYAVFKTAEEANNPKMRLGRGETIRVREVLPDDVSDSLMLEFMIKESAMISKSPQNIFYCEIVRKGGVVSFGEKTPRQAILAAMKEGK